MSNLTTRSSNLRRPLRRRGRQRIAGVLLSFVLVPSVGSAELPDAVQRAARTCGWGWSDGYHACSSSGCRPLADLPPRSFAAWQSFPPRFDESCPNCPSPRATLAGYPSGGTFYDHFDAQSHAFSMAERSRTLAMTPRAIQPLVDPEQGRYPTSAWPEFRMPPHPPQSTWPSPIVRSALDPTTEASAKDEVTDEHEPPNPPATPQLTDEEREAIRDYQEHQRLKKKYQPYLVDPNEFVPSQQWGGPPAGSEQRRRLDEAKVEALRRRDAEAPTSPSDQPPTKSIREDDDRGLPMEDLLPPFPDHWDVPGNRPAPADPYALQDDLLAPPSARPLGNPPADRSPSDPSTRDEFTRQLNRSTAVIRQPGRPAETTVAQHPQPRRIEQPGPPVATATETIAAKPSNVLSGATTVFKHFVMQPSTQIAETPPRQFVRQPTRR